MSFLILIARQRSRTSRLRHTTPASSARRGPHRQSRIPRSEHTRLRSGSLGPSAWCPWPGQVLGKTVHKWKIIARMLHNLTVALLGFTWLVAAPRSTAFRRRRG